MSQLRTEPTHVTISIAFAALAAAVFFNSKTTLVLVMSGLSFIFAAFGANLLYWSMIVEHLPELRNRDRDLERRRIPGPMRVAGRWLYLWTRQLRAPTQEHRAELGYLNVLASMLLVNLAITIRGLEHLWALI